MLVLWNRYKKSLKKKQKSVYGINLDSHWWTKQLYTQFSHEEKYDYTVCKKMDGTGDRVN